MKCPRKKLKVLHEQNKEHFIKTKTLIYLNVMLSPQLIIKQKKYDGSDKVFWVSKKRNILWILLRSYCKTIPGRGGFVSITGNVPNRQTIIGYFLSFINLLQNIKLCKNV